MQTKYSSKRSFIRDQGSPVRNTFPKSTSVTCSPAPGITTTNQSYLIPWAFPHPTARKSPIVAPAIIFSLHRRISLWSCRLLHRTGTDTAIFRGIGALRRLAKAVPEVFPLGFDLPSVRGCRAGFLVLALDEAVERLGCAFCAAGDALACCERRRAGLRCEIRGGKLERGVC